MFKIRSSHLALATYLPDNVIERISVSKMEEYLGLLGCIIKNKQTNDNNKKLKLFPAK